MNRIYNKYNLDPKYIKCAGCPKPAESRLSKVNKSGFITAFRSPNNTELCCKCAEKEEFLNVCYKCRRKGQRRTSFGLSEIAHLYIEDKDNPSGEWWVYCCSDCLPADHPERWGEMVWESTAQSHIDEQYFKPNSPAEGKSNPSSNSENRTEWVAKCDHCRKSSEIKVSNAFWGKYFCSVDCYELAFARLSTKICDEIRARCCTCNFRIFGEDRNFTEDFKNRKGKVYYSDRSINAFYCSETCFEKRRDKSGMSGSAFYDRNPVQSDNSPKPNPVVPALQSVTNSNDQSDEVKVNPGSSPKPNPGKGETSETKNNVETIRFEKNPVNPASEKSPNKTSDNETLIINLNNVKKISLNAEGNLMIEFKKEEQWGNYSTFQTITLNQVNSSQELQKVKNYLEKNNQNSLNQQELDKLFSKSNNSVSPEKLKDNNNILLIGGSIMFGTLIVGMGIGLFLRRKRKLKKS